MIVRKLKRYIAERRLQKLVEETRQSYAVQDFAKRRAAMLKHTRARA